MDSTKVNKGLKLEKKEKVRLWSGKPLVQNDISITIGAAYCLNDLLALKH